MILYRIAKVSDAKQIAQIHYSVRHKHPLGIFSQMGFSFLKQYYRVILDDPYEIIICAENDKREIVGFNSGTLDANWQMNTLRRHKLSLGLAALGSIICNPRLIKPLVQRYKSTAKKSNYQFVYKEGAPIIHICIDRGCSPEVMFQTALKSFGQAALLNFLNQL